MSITLTPPNYAVAIHSHHNRQHRVVLSNYDEATALKHMALVPYIGGFESVEITPTIDEPTAESAAEWMFT